MSGVILQDERDYEIINGKIYMMSRPNMNHIRITGNIFGIFQRFLMDKECEVFSEPDVFFNEENNFIPDIVVLCDKSKDKYKGIYGAPDLVIEILSPSTDVKDLGEKKDVYGKTGVKEYWIVDPKSKKIIVYYLSGGSLEINNVYYYCTAKQIEKMPDDEKKAIVSSFKSLIFSDLEIELSQVFKNVVDLGLY
ncbi:MAG: Uma2 family endonuclease [Oscillospiraceae bacterium]|nr:Uma2 family endonuclease [Oscillospiraceae bacterium]